MRVVGVELRERGEGASLPLRAQVVYGAISLIFACSVVTFCFVAGSLDWDQERQVVWAKPQEAFSFIEQVNLALTLLWEG